jgi:hypothetical protein
MEQPQGRGLSLIKLLSKLAKFIEQYSTTENSTILQKNKAMHSEFIKLIQRLLNTKPSVAFLINIFKILAAEKFLYSIDFTAPVLRLSLINYSIDNLNDFIIPSWYNKILRLSLKKTRLSDARDAFVQLQSFSRVQILKLAFSQSIITLATFKLFLTENMLIELLQEGAEGYIDLCNIGLIQTTPNCVWEEAGTKTPEIMLKLIKNDISRGTSLDMVRIQSIAARYGLLEVLIFLQANEFELESEITYFAAKYNQLDVLKWAQANFCPWNNRLLTPTFNKIPFSDHPEIVKWLKTKSTIRENLKW